MLLLTRGGKGVHLRKLLVKRIKRQQTPRHALIVAIADESRTHDQPNDGLVEG